VEEFKREMSKVIRRKLIETKRPPISIEKWYECTTCCNLNNGDILRKVMVKIGLEKSTCKKE